MGSEEEEADATPKLSLYSLSLPSKVPPPPPGSLTPPLHSGASIPFEWEEAPGKPRAVISVSRSNLPASNGDNNNKSRAARCLDLPPRLVLSTSTVNSPKTVLEGPYNEELEAEGWVRSVSDTLSFSFGSGGDQEKVRSRRNKYNYGKTWSRRWGSFKDSSSRRASTVGTSFDFSSSYSGAASGTGTGEVKITRVRRRRSFLSFSKYNSSIVASLYGSLKQAVPWRRRN